MARSIVWSDPAVDDLEAAVNFIAKDSEAYARSLAQLTVDAAESLRTFPNRGHRLPHPKFARFRELIIGSYRLVYLVERKRILHLLVRRRGSPHGRSFRGSTERAVPMEDRDDRS